MIPLRVRGLAPATEHGHAMAVLETEGGDLRLAIVVPANEAGRLARALGLTPCGCTPIFELVATLVRAFGATIAGAVMEGHSRGIGASLLLAHGGDTLRLPCHPADALALAVRAGAPVHATPEALAHACPAVDGPGEPGPGRAAADADVRRWLQQVRPGDFRLGHGDGA